MTPTTRSDGGQPECTCAAKMKLTPGGDRHASWCPLAARWTITSNSPSTEEIADQALDAIMGGAPSAEIRVATNGGALGVLAVLYRRAEARGLFDATVNTTELWLGYRDARITVVATEAVRDLDQAIVRAAESSGALGEMRDQARLSLADLIRKPLTEEGIRDHLRSAGVPVGGPRSGWKSRVELVNELLDQAEVTRQQALLTPHNQGLLAKIVPLLGRAARALEDREQGLPIFLGTSERTTDLIGWVKTNDPKITQKVLASSAVLPTVVMGGADRDEPVIVAYGLVLRTMVDTRPNAHLGEGDPDDDRQKAMKNLIAAAERFMEAADPMPPDGVDRSLELSDAIRDARRVAS